MLVYLADNRCLFPMFLQVYVNSCVVLCFACLVSVSIDGLHSARHGSAEYYDPSVYIDDLTH